MNNDLNTSHLVGPVLQSGSVADAITQAILGSNNDVELVDRGSYVRISVPDQCKLRRAAVEMYLGRAFELPRDLEAVLVSFKGRIDITDDLGDWSYNQPAKGDET
jgi:toluene monooxygenase system protein D